MIKSQMQKLRTLIVFLIVGICYFSFSAAAYAQSICPTGEFENLCKLRLDSASDIVSSVVTILLVLASLLSVLFLIWSSIRWITSGGEKGKVDEARKGIVASIVGLILAFVAFFILSIVTYLFTGASITDFTIPTIVP